MGKSSQDVSDRKIKHLHLREPFKQPSDIWFHKTVCEDPAGSTIRVLDRGLPSLKQRDANSKDNLARQRGQVLTVPLRLRAQATVLISSTGTTGAEALGFPSCVTVTGGEARWPGVTLVYHIWVCPAGVWGPHFKEEMRAVCSQPPARASKPHT